MNIAFFYEVVSKNTHKNMCCVKKKNLHFALLDLHFGILFMQTLTKLLVEMADQFCGASVGAGISKLCKQS